MANDYLSGSQFGNVAGALLARKRRGDRREMRNALIASTIFETFGALQRKQKTNLAKDMEDLKFEYDSVFRNNEAQYRLAQKNRAEYQSYLEDKDEYVRIKAIELFNKDPSVLASGKNYAQISSLDPNSQKFANELFSQYKDKALKDIQKMGEAPEIFSPTFEKYNQAAVNSYKAKYAQLRDDPTRQSLLAAAWHKIFGNPDDPSKGAFGTTRGKLEDAVETAELAKQAQERLSLNYMEPSEQQDKNISNKSADTHNKVSEEVGLTPLYSVKERMQLDRDALISKMNEQGYKLTIEDLHKAGELGVAVPGLSGFNDILANERPTLQSAFIKAEKARSEGLEPLDVLEGNEREVYARAIGTTAMEYDTRNMQFELNELRLEEARRPKGEPLRTTRQFEDEIQNENVREVVGVAIKDTLIGLEKQGKLGEDMQDIADLLENDLFNENGDNQYEYFVTRVMRTAQALQKEQPEIYGSREGIGESFRRATEIQLSGIVKQADGAFGGRRFTFEPVDRTFMSLLDQDITKENEARYLVYGLNNYSYAKRLDPLFQGNEFFEGNFRFFTDQEGRWNYELIGD